MPNKNESATVAKSQKISELNGALDWIGGFVVPGRHDDSMLLRVYESSYPRYWMHKQLIHMYLDVHLDYDH